MSAPLLILDTETTSLRRDRRVWEVGMIRIDHLGPREFGAFVDDVDLSRADVRSLEIGGFYDRHPAYRVGPSGDDHLMPEREAAYHVERWTRGAHIVGAVPNFDTEVLSGMLFRHRLVPAWHYHLLDVETLVTGWLMGMFAREPRKEALAYETPTDGRTVQLARPSLPWKSEDLSRAIGVDPDRFDRHTALGDCRWARAQLEVVAPGLIEAAAGEGR